MYEYFEILVDGLYDGFVNLVGFDCFGAFFIVAILFSVFALVKSFFVGCDK